MEENQSSEWRSKVVIALVIIAVLVAAGFGVRSMFGKSGTEAKKPPKISLLPSTPPPPPPPPPKVEKPPEPPKEQKEMKVDQVEKKVEQPADAPIKMEGAAGDGPSMFASGKVTNENVGQATGGAGGPTVGGPAVTSPLVNPFNTYATAIRTELQRQLARRSELKRRQYQVEVRVWVAEDGRLKNFELLGTTNDGDTDEAIRSVLAKLPAFSDPPPARMPQPIRLRIVASGRA